MPIISQFIRYELRTTDPDAAQAFYSSLLGHKLSCIWPLHEQARARGAVPHWLGHLSIGEGTELETVGQQFVERGAVLLSPTLVTPDRGQFFVLRDPGGAMLALNASTQPAESGPVVGWHVLNTNNISAAKQNYHELFGWEIEDQPVTGPYGDVYEFAYTADSGEPVGVLADIADRPSIHPHWLFFFKVSSLDSALNLVRQAGGTATEPFVGPNGTRVSVCEDVQRAAFGLIEA